MKKYKNITSTALALDCISKTIYLKPGETMYLPRTRDVRYYSGLGKLKLVREKNTTLPLKKEVRQIRLDEKGSKKFRKTFKKQEVSEEKEEQNKE